MCGIIGYVGRKQNALSVLLDGLKALEYRGYDSAGVAFYHNGKLEIIKEKGNISSLEKSIDYSVSSSLGIGHTRWATHGKPDQRNAHPHKIGKITIVHNGIIENYEELKFLLEEYGYTFTSDTDTEIACALIDKLYQEKNDMVKVLEQCKNLLKGSYAMGILIDDEKNTLYAVRKDSPLIIGLGMQEHYIASDVPAILKYTKNYLLLEDSEVVKINDTVTVYNNKGLPVEKEVHVFEADEQTAMKNGYDHFMMKEIMEQPKIIRDTISSFLSNGIVSLEKQMPDFLEYDKLHIVACGSAYHTGLVGKSLIESISKMPVTVDIASEYRYNHAFLEKNTLVIIISQSGETADSLAALKMAKSNGLDTLAIVNTVGSSIAREADFVLYIKAGIEIAVATTKAYSAQIAVLSLISLFIALKKELMDEHDMETFLGEFHLLQDNIHDVFAASQHYLDIASKIYEHKNLFFIGRGIDYSLAQEASLKLKEISYIHSEAYPSGELKHGSISLIEESTPVIALATETHLLEKTISNIKEVKARGAYVIFVTTEDLDRNSDFYDEKIIIPRTHALLQPLLTIIPMQLLSYYVANLNGCDIDKPRNLAKSVTVE